MREAVPLSNGDPACWRPAWGGVRLRGNGWWVRVIFGGWCRFAQDDTVGDRGAVPNMFGANVSPARPPSSGASRHLPPRRGRLFRWCVALCNTSQQWRSHPTPANEPSEAKGKILRRHPKPRLEPPSGKVLKIPKLHRKGHPKTQYVSPRTTSRVPFAVKFLESLEPSPKEGSKRGLGRRPKVFPPQRTTSSRSQAGRPGARRRRKSR